MKQTEISTKGALKFLVIFFGTLFVVMMIWFNVFPSNPMTPQEQRAQQYRLDEAQKKLKQVQQAREADSIEWDRQHKARISKLKSAVQGMMQDGLIVRMECKSYKVYVKPVIWHNQTIMLKEKISLILSEYCSLKNNAQGAPLITILDAYSGKTLAKIGILGFKAY